MRGQEFMCALAAFTLSLSVQAIPLAAPHLSTLKRAAPNDEAQPQGAAAANPLSGLLGGLNLGGAGAGGGATDPLTAISDLTAGLPIKAATGGNDADEATGGAAANPLSGLLGGLGLGGAGGAAGGAAGGSPLDAITANLPIKRAGDNDTKAGAAKDGADSDDKPKAEADTDDKPNAAVDTDDKPKGAAGAADADADASTQSAASDNPLNGLLSGLGLGGAGGAAGGNPLDALTTGLPIKRADVAASASVSAEAEAGAGAQTDAAAAANPFSSLMGDLGNLDPLAAAGDLTAAVGVPIKRN